MSAELRLRSILFVPGDRDDRFAKALGSGADAVVFDLEDAVAPGRKAAARELVARLLASPRGAAEPARLVRINSAGSGFLDADLHALKGLGPDALVLPKAVAADVDALPAWVPPVLAIVETARGLRGSAELAATPRVLALVLGAVDLGVELGLEPRSDGQELLLARSTLVLDSAAALIRAPIDSVHTALADLGGLAAETELGRSLGMGGKLCVHPSQVPIVNAAYTPSVERVAWASAIVAAYDAAAAAGSGVVSVNGQMVDLPVVVRARGILATAARP